MYDVHLFLVECGVVYTLRKWIINYKIVYSYIICPTAHQNQNRILFWLKKTKKIYSNLNCKAKQVGEFMLTYGYSLLYYTYYIPLRNLGYIELPLFGSANHKFVFLYTVIVTRLKSYEGRGV